jgi:hypothetical protein
MHEVADRVPELLQRQRKQRDGTWYIPREVLERLCLVNVRMKEFPEREVFRELQLERRFPRRHFVEEARQHVRVAIRVRKHAAGLQDIAHPFLEATPIDNPQSDRAPGRGWDRGRDPSSHGALTHLRLPGRR